MDLWLIGVIIYAVIAFLHGCVVAYGAMQYGELSDAFAVIIVALFWSIFFLAFIADLLYLLTNKRLNNVNRTPD